MPGENEKAEKFPGGNACKEEKEEETGVGGESLQSMCPSPGKGGRETEGSGVRRALDCTPAPRKSQPDHGRASERELLMV